MPRISDHTKRQKSSPSLKSSTIATAPRKGYQRAYGIMKPSIKGIRSSKKKCTEKYAPPINFSSRKNQVIKNGKYKSSQAWRKFFTFTNLIYRPLAGNKYYCVVKIFYFYFAVSFIILAVQRPGHNVFGIYERA